MSDGFAIQKAGFLVIPGLGVGVGLTHLTLRKASWFSQCSDTTPRMPGARRSPALLIGSLFKEYTGASPGAAAPGPTRSLALLIGSLLKEYKERRARSGAPRLLDLTVPSAPGTPLLNLTGGPSGPRLQSLFY